LLGLFGLTLASCTGSSEQPIQALVAVASNGVDNKYQILFYASSTLQPGDLSTTTPTPVGSWTLNEPIVAIRYQRNLADPSDNKFWVLSQTRLRRYSTKNMTISNVGTPIPNFEQLLGVDCSLGYLRPGPNKLLVVCPKINTSTTPPSESTTELPTAWLIDVNNPVLDPANPLQLTGFTGLDRIPVRLALTNSDQLMYLTPGFIGLGSDITDTTTQKNLRSLQTPPDPNANPKELAIATDSGGSTRAYGLLAISSSSETFGLSWDLSSNAPLPFKESQVTSAQIASGSPPIVLFGTGLARIEGGQLQFPPTLLNPGQQYAAAMVGLDQFLYLGQKDSWYLWVVDLFPAFKDLTTSSVRQITLDATGNLRPIALAFIPVE